MALSDDDIAEYLPDKDDLESNYMDRSFLFTVVNSLEPTFFKRVLDEYHEKNQAKFVEVNPQVDITEEMLKVLENYIKTSWKRRPMDGTKANLGKLRNDKEKKKRDKAAERQKRDEAKIQITS
jgi:hypothetical protein